MMFLPDTNVWIRFFKSWREPGKKIAFFQLIHQQFGFVRLLKAELFFGAMKSTRIPENLALLDELFVDFESLSFEDDAARKYGEIRSDLARKGTPIGPNDLMIAAIASVHEAVLVTHNTREFTRVTGLKVEDWE